MYKVMKEDTLVGYSDTAVYVKLHTNGCYVPCSQSEAQGVCVKTPYTYEVTDEETGEVSTITSVRDVVYALEEGALNGTEEVVSLENINGPLIVQEIKDILYTIIGSTDLISVEEASKINKYIQAGMSFLNITKEE